MSLFRRRVNACTNRNHVHSGRHAIPHTESRREERGERGERGGKREEREDREERVY